MSLRHVARIAGILAGVAGLGGCYWCTAIFVVGLGIGNQQHFRSEAFRLERANRLLAAIGKSSAMSADGAALALLPTGAADVGWWYEAGDDSWLCSVVSLHWHAGAEWHNAQWLMRYCADALWGEHFIEAVALNREAHTLTPLLARRDSIYGDGNVPFRPMDGALCIVQ